MDLPKSREELRQACIQHALNEYWSQPVKRMNGEIWPLSWCCNAADCPPMLRNVYLAGAQVEIDKVNKSFELRNACAGQRSPADGADNGQFIKGLISAVIIIAVLMLAAALAQQ